MNYYFFIHNHNFIELIIKFKTEKSRKILLQFRYETSIIEVEKITNNVYQMYTYENRQFNLFILYINKFKYISLYCFKYIHDKL